ncbi:hypothetical protein IWX49DRAFT_292803 [Phyllosticta citricarpa]
MIKRPKFRSLRLVACYELIPFLSVPRKPILNHLSGCTSTSAEPLLRQAPAWLRTVRNRRRFFTATPSHTLTVASVCPHAAASALPVHLLDALLPQAELHLHMHLDSAAHRVLVTEEDPGQDPSRNSPPPAETHNLLLSVGRGEAHHPGPGVEIVLRHCYYGESLWFVYCLFIHIVLPTSNPSCKRGALVVDPEADGGLQLFSSSGCQAFLVQPVA